MSGFTLLEDRELWYFLDDIPEPPEEEEEMAKSEFRQQHKTKATIAEQLRTTLISLDQAEPRSLPDLISAVLWAIADLEGDSIERVGSEIRTQRKALGLPELEVW